MIVFISAGHSRTLLAPGIQDPLHATVYTGQRTKIPNSPLKYRTSGNHKHQPQQSQRFLVVLNRLRNAIEYH